MAGIGKCTECVRFSWIDENPNNCSCRVKPGYVTKNALINAYCNKYLTFEDQLRYYKTLFSLHDLFSCSTKQLLELRVKSQMLFDRTWKHETETIIELTTLNKTTVKQFTRNQFPRNRERVKKITKVKCNG